VSLENGVDPWSSCPGFEPVKMIFDIVLKSVHSILEFGSSGRSPYETADYLLLNSCATAIFGSKCSLLNSVVLVDGLFQFKRILPFTLVFQRHNTLINTDQIVHSQDYMPFIQD
jgi:hypothetical protein